MQREVVGEIVCINLVMMAALHIRSGLSTENESGESKT